MTSLNIHFMAYLDSPLAIEATKAVTKICEQALMKKQSNCGEGINPLVFPGLKTSIK